MAKVRLFGIFGPEEVEPLPSGSLRFADPSASEFPRHIHTFNDPYSKNNAFGEQRGVDSQTGDLVPWHDRHTNRNLAREYNKKRGVYEEDEE